MQRMHCSDGYNSYIIIIVYRRYNAVVHGSTSVTATITNEYIYRRLPVSVF